MSKYNGSTITDNLLNKQSGKWAQKLSDKQHNDQDYIDILYTLKKKYSLKNNKFDSLLFNSLDGKISCSYCTYTQMLVLHIK